MCYIVVRPLRAGIEGVVHDFLIAVIAFCPLAVALLNRSADFERLREPD